MRRLSYSKPPGDQFQQSTFRTEKSVSGLPSGSDREKEQALPEGAATPNSVSSDGKPADKAQGVGQRALPYGTFNGPASGSGTVDKARTKPVPGDQYGSPSKDDYGYLTRRTMTGADSEGLEADIVAYKPRKHGPSSYKPHPFGWRRHRQKPQQRAQRRKLYRVRRSRELQQARRRYRTRYRMSARFKQRRKLCRRFPNRCKMRPNPRPKTAHVDVTPNAIPFLYGCDLHQGFVVDVTLEGQLVLELEDGTETTISATAFVATVLFLDDTDIDAVDYLLESSDAEEPYGDPTVLDVAAASNLHRIAAPAEGTPDEQLDAIFEVVMSECEKGEAVRTAFDTFLYDQTPASELSNNWLNRKEPTREMSDTRPYRENAPGQWTRNRKEQTHTPSDGADTSPNPTYYQGGSGKVIPDDMRLAAAWGRTIVGGVFEAPPGLIAAIEAWALPLYAGHILDWLQPKLKSMGRDVAGAALTDLARIRAEFPAAVASLQRPADSVVITAPKVKHDGTVRTYYIGIKMMEPDVYLLDIGDKRPTFRRQEVLNFPKAMSNVIHDVAGTGKYSVVSQLEDIARRVSDSRKLDKPDDQLLVDLSLIQREARRYTDKAMTVKSVRNTKIPLTDAILSGWRYSDRLPPDALERLRAAGHSDIGVQLNFNPNESIAGGWYPDQFNIELYIPRYLAYGLPYPFNLEQFKAGITQLRDTIRHEVQHAGQTILKIALGLKEQGGLPPRAIRDLRYNPSGARPGYPLQNHAERDVEFHTRLQDEIDAFVFMAPRIPMNVRARALAAWTGTGPVVRGSELGTPGESGIMIREFFSALKAVQRKKWLRAVFEFVSGVRAAGIRVPTGGVLP
jgi:hypothetical protein